MVSFLNETDKQNIMEKPVMKMEIRYKEVTDMKEQKMLGAIKQSIDKSFSQAGITKHDGDMYIGNGNDRDYAAFGKVAISMMKDVILLKYIDEWLYYDEYGNICDCGARSKKDAGLLPADAPDKTMYNDEKLSVMKMEIRYKEATEPKDKRALDNLINVVDELFKRCGIVNKDGDFYIGNDDAHDYARFGMVFGELNDWKVFLKHVNVWNFYDEHGEVEDFSTPSKQKVGME